MLRTILGLFRKPEQPKDIKVPAGYRLVPEIPSDEHVESMCRRFDHSHEYKHNFPLEESGEMFRARQDFNRRVVRQIYEEAVGSGFYLCGESCGASGGVHDWVYASNSFVKSGYYCTQCGAITGSKPVDVRTAGSVAGEAYQVIGSITSQLPDNDQVTKALDYFASIANGRDPGGSLLPFADPEWGEPDRTVEPPLATYPCRGCGKQTGVEDWEEFDPDTHYCGRSERCIP